MTDPSNLPDSQSNESTDEFSYLELLIVLAKYKKLIFGMPIVIAMVAAGFSLVMPDIYTATTKILVPQSQSAASAVLAQLGGGIAGLVGGGAKGPGEVYIAMLNSRTVADKLIARFDVMKSTGAKFPSQARQALAGVTRITSGKEGVLSIEVDDNDPRRAAHIANAYVEELLVFTQVLAVTEASQRRLFFERQFALAKDNLVSAETAARKALQSGGIVKVDDQGRAMVEANARLRGQITVKEVQIGAMRAFAADHNPELRLAQQELASMKHELAKIEGAGGTSAGSNGPSGQGIDSLRLLRDVKYHEVIFDLLARQYELAKIDEAKDSAVVQVMDRAIEPDRKSKPNRRLIVSIAAFGALFVAILLVFVREAMVRSGSDPQQATRLQNLKRHLTWR